MIYLYTGALALLWRSPGCPSLRRWPDSCRRKRSIHFRSSPPAGKRSPEAGMEAGTTPWSTGLFDCAEDHGVCLLGWCCPCIVVGRVAEILDKGATSSGSAACLYVAIGVLTAWECQWIYSCVNRTKMRAQYGLQENPCPDCCVHFWLESCAICQEYRELRNRGFVMDIGWEANLELQKQQGRVEGSTVPPAMQHMI